MPFMQQLKFAALLIVALIGAFGVSRGIEDLQLSKHAEPEPQELTLAELSANGFGDNAHVIVHDAYMLEWEYIYSERRGRWLYAYVPAVSLESTWYQAFEAGLDDSGMWPTDRELPEFDGVDMLVKLTDVHSDEDVVNASADTTVQGVVINAVDSLDHDEKLLLGSSFPGVDLDSCVILEFGREPATAGQAQLLILGGALVLLVGCVLGFFAWRKYKREQAETAAED